MPSNKKKHPVGRKSVRNTKSSACNYNSKESCTTKSQDARMTDLNSKDSAKENIKQCRVLLTPLPQKVLNEKHMEKTEIINKPQPTVKMKNVCKSRAIFKTCPRRPPKETILKVDEATVNQRISLKNNNTQINFVTSSDEILRENPKKYTQKKESRLMKKPLIDRTNLNKPSPLQKLRTRKVVNYAESSLEISKDCQKTVNTNKIPVYKQQTTNEEKLKKHEDTYEFDSDTETRIKRKKRKHNNSSSDEYNKTIENILKNVATKIKRKKKIFPNYKNNNNKDIKLAKPSKLPRKKENVHKKPIINVTSEIKNSEVEKHITSEMMIKIPHPNVVQQENAEVQDYSDDDDVNFGFDGPEANKENSPKIKIISDIRLSPNKELNLSWGTPKLREVRPIAHSTALPSVLTPWRFNDMNIVRNPHFITLKESSLPCINQDMVLDHTMVDKFADTSKTESAKTPLRISDEKMQNHKKMVQSIVSDFFESASENKENENTELNLFDNDQFSPIKSKHKFGSKVDLVKRRILGDLNDNKKQMYASTPKQNASNLRVPKVAVRNKDSTNSDENLNFEENQKKKTSREFTNYGFTSSDEENEIHNSPSKARDNKPFRLNVRATDKKYPVKQKLKQPEKAESIINSDSESEMCELSDAEGHNGEVKLFEDFVSTDNDERFLESKFKKKKKKLKWMDNYYNTDTQKHRRRKDIRTMEEEAEAEKWAADFNSMCEEIDKFPLEIE